MLLTTLNRLTAQGCLKYCFNGLNLKMDLHRHMSSTQCAQCVYFMKLLQYKGSCRYILLLLVRRMLSRGFAELTITFINTPFIRIILSMRTYQY